MADYFVSASGSNTAPYDTWAKAATSLQTALTAASSGADRVIIQHNGVPTTDAELAADTTYTAAANVTVISASNDGGSSFTFTPMGESGWIGNSTASRSITFAGGYVIACYGLTLLVSGANSRNIICGGSDNQAFVFKEGRCHMMSTGGTASVRIGYFGGIGHNSSCVFEDVVFRFGAGPKTIEIGGSADFLNCTIDPSGSARGTLFDVNLIENGGWVRLHGCDLSHVTGSLVGDMQGGSRKFDFYACKLAAGVVPLAAQSITNQSAVEVELRDCSSGDTHYHFSYHNALGSLSVETGIYANDGAQYDGTNRCSWKIVTTAYASRQNPFQTPWVSKYHSGTSAITPSFEILRDGSASAYTDAQVWGEWSVKATAGSVKASIYNDRVSIGATGSAQATGVGLAGWTGESATAWSGKLAPESSITPAEVGDICARVCVGVPSATVYVDPTIRGA